MDHPRNYILSACAGIAALISIFASIHAHRTLPWSRYAIFLQLAFVFDTATSLLTVVYFLPTVSESPTYNAKAFLASIKLGFVLMGVMFVMAQSEFLHTIVPTSELVSVRLKMATRVFAVIGGGLGIVCSFYMYFPPPIDMVGSKTHVGVIALLALFDVMLNAYMVWLALIMFRRAGTRLRVMLIMAWSSCMTIFILLFLLQFLFTSNQTLTSYITTIVSLFYIAQSYSVIVIVRVMLQRQSNSGKKYNAPPAIVSTNPGEIPIVSSNMETSQSRMRSVDADSYDVGVFSTPHLVSRVG